MKTIGMIPSRLQSSRLPRKVLSEICGIPMIVHVYRRCRQAKNLSDVFVVTDSDEIKKVVESYGGQVLMTGSHHQSGTDRIAEAANQIECDIVVNIQGDEVLVKPEHIDIVVEALKNDENAQAAILTNHFRKYNSPSDIKVVVDENNYVMYFSRSDIPSGARTPNPPMFKAYHVVPFRKNFLIKYTNWEKGNLETIEFNEYLRILEKGYKIRAINVESDAISVDTPEDLEFVRGKMVDDPIFETYR